MNLYLIKRLNGPDIWSVALTLSKAVENITDVRSVELIATEKVRDDIPLMIFHS